MANSGAVPVRVLFYNTFLLRVLPLPVVGWLHSKPAIDARSREIGAALQGAYDVAALAEVFHPPDREALLDAWGEEGIETAVGPVASPPRLLTSSGLLTVARRPLVRTAQHVFRESGHRLLDVDSWAAKGVLMAEVDIGMPVGNLEVYSTHVLYGGDLLSGSRRLSPEVPRIRQAQVEEMIAFADATRRPENVAVLMGDLNVDAHGRGPDGDIDEGAHPAAALQRSFADAGYDDAWALGGEGPGWTCDLLLAPEQFPVDPAEPDLCADPAPPATGHHEVRIDYAFLQRPVPAHGFDLQLDRVARRPFPRPAGAPDLDLIATMSDHLGLHLELSASPR